MMSYGVREVALSLFKLMVSAEGPPLTERESSESIQICIGTEQVKGRVLTASVYLYKALKGAESFFLNCPNGGSSTASDCPETFIKGRQSS